ncbi:MAG: helix-turn-helix domain-containing protein [Methylocystis sp.]
MSRAAPKQAKRPVKFDVGVELLASVREMKAGARARIHKPDVPEFVRARLASGLSQAEFAALLGVSVRTLQDWEQGRRKPSGAALTLYKIAERRPEVLRELAA